jgi:hypothetical protein
MRTLRWFSLSLLGALSPAATTRAYEVTTHDKLTCRAIAARRDMLDDKLRAIFDLDLGDNLALRNGTHRSIPDWLSRGAIEEDDRSRFFHHFHDPLQPLASAGLFHQQRSAIEWMLKPAGAQSASETYDMSWFDAREYYLRGLTRSSAADREHYQALMFKALGHLMHLVQDQAVPAHARNDAHLPVPGELDWYHRYVDLQARFMLPPLECEASDPAYYGGLWFGMGSIDPSPELLTGTRSDGLLPIANLIDADAYDGTNANAVTFNPGAFGVGEYTNANFFSEDTIEEDYLEPFLDRSQWLGTAGYMYFRLDRLGQTVVNPVAFAEYMDLGGGFFLEREPSVEDPYDAVPRAYALALLPKAIGYSASLLDYFFRAKFESVKVDQDTFRIRNTGGEALEGTFTVYYEDSSLSRQELTQHTFGLLAPNAESSDWDFTAPYDVSDPGNYVVVFEGKIGTEEHGVAGVRAALGCPAGMQAVPLAQSYQCLPIPGQPQVCAPGCPMALIPSGCTCVSPAVFGCVLQPGGWWLC